MSETTMKNQEILNALNKKIKAAEEVLLYLNQTKEGLERVIEKQKSPAEEAYKKWWGTYPPIAPSVSNYEDNRWSDFQKGYKSAQKDWKE
jgi:hypothetical protein